MEREFPANDLTEGFCGLVGEAPHLAIDHFRFGDEALAFEVIADLVEAVDFAELHEKFHSQTLHF